MVPAAVGVEGGGDQRVVGSVDIGPATGSEIVVKILIVESTTWVLDRGGGLLAQAVRRSRAAIQRMVSPIG